MRRQDRGSKKSARAPGDVTASRRRASCGCWRPCRSAAGSGCASRKPPRLSRRRVAKPPRDAPGRSRKRVAKPPRDAPGRSRRRVAEPLPACAQPVWRRWRSAPTPPESAAGRPLRGPHRRPGWPRRSSFGQRRSAARWRRACLRRRRDAPARRPACPREPSPSPRPPPGRTLWEPAACSPPAPRSSAAPDSGREAASPGTPPTPRPTRH